MVTLTKVLSPIKICWLHLGKKGCTLRMVAICCNLVQLGNALEAGACVLSLTDRLQHANLKVGGSLL